MGTDHEGRGYINVGGSQGMGKATALSLACEGAALALIGRTPAGAARAAQAIGAQTGAQLGGFDTTDGMDIAIERAAQSLGRLGSDGRADTSHGTLLDLTDEQWAESFDTQLMTVVRAALPILAGQGGGSIVTTSAYSIRAPKATLPHYAAMKSAIATLTKGVAKHYGAQGIRANCIAPGAIATEALGKARETAVRRFGGEPAEALWKLMSQEWGMKAALDRIGDPAEVAELIGFLLSGRAAYITGALINIDGGTDF